MGPANSLRPRLGQAEGAVLSSLDQVVHCSCGIFRRHLGVEAVLVERIDTIGAQAPERVISELSNLLGATVEPATENSILITIGFDEAERANASRSERTDDS